MKWFNKLIKLIERWVIKHWLFVVLLIARNNLNIFDAERGVFHVTDVMFGVYFHGPQLGAMSLYLLFQFDDFLSKGSNFVLVLDFHELHFLLVQLLNLTEVIRYVHDLHEGLMWLVLEAEYLCLEIVLEETTVLAEFW